MKYKKGDLVRVKDNGSIMYFLCAFQGKAQVSLKNPLMDELYYEEPFCYEYDEIEPLNNMHKYYGKMVRVWMKDDPIGTKHERILLDVRNNGVVAVYEDDKEYFRMGNVYHVDTWDFWEPIQEQSKPPNHLPTHAEIQAFEIVRGYFERIKE